MFDLICHIVRHLPLGYTVVVRDPVEPLFTHYDIRTESDRHVALTSLNYGWNDGDVLVRVVRHEPFTLA